ncbi:MAG: hypothetical protein N3E36_04995 [Sulfolobales archaeon]|nr:hypothetical protein [Sulfolobales archaeon]MCX8199371.1 hypothetical protein [Sulfolobales archaeon]MDW8170315.1 hypothetical protein [Desulfurococcaceae archaeon]
MPVKYVCHNCGHILWEFTRVGQDYYGMPTPSEVYNAYGGICPSCKRSLKKPSEASVSIRARILEEVSIPITQGLLSQHVNRVTASTALA